MRKFELSRRYVYEDFHLIIIMKGILVHLITILVSTVYCICY